MMRTIAVAAIALSLFPCFADAAELYFTDSVSGRIRRYDTDTSAFTLLVPRTDQSNSPLAIELDRSIGKMFWTDGVTHQVRRANLDGTAIETLFTSPATTFGPYDVSLDRVRSRLYWADTGTGRILSSNLDGTDARSLVVGLDDPSAIAVHSALGKMYWADDTHTIRRANLDGTGIETVINSFGPADMTIDEQAGKIYWTAGFQIHRANLDGTAQEELLDGRFSRNFYALALDPREGKVYWSDLLSSARVGRMNLDGSNQQTVITGSQVDPSSIQGLAIDPIPEPGTLALCAVAALGVALWVVPRRGCWQSAE